MTEESLTFPATEGAPIACDMTGATDTADERIAEYGRLFAHALVGRERRRDAVEFRFAKKAGVKEWVFDLARREAECCPFLTLNVRVDEHFVRYEFIVDADHSAAAALQASLDEIHALPDRHHDGLEGMLTRLAPYGVSKSSDTKPFVVSDTPPPAPKSSCGC